MQVVERNWPHICSHHFMSEESWTFDKAWKSTRAVFNNPLSKLRWQSCEQLKRREALTYYTSQEETDEEA